MTEMILRRTLLSYAGAGLAVLAFPRVASAAGKEELPGADGAEFEEFSCAALTMQVPKDWQVQPGSVHLGLDHVVRIFDPENPLTQAFIGIRADGPMHTIQGKQFWDSQRNGQYSHMPVLKKQTTAAFFRIFNVYYAALRRKSPRMYAGISFPTFSSGFREEDLNKAMKASYPMTAKARMSRVIHATFSQSGRDCEGFFSADVTDIYSDDDNRVEKEEIPFVKDDHGYYTVYNIAGVAAEKGQLQEKAGLLIRAIASIRYSEALMKAIREQVKSEFEKADELAQLPELAAGMFSEVYRKRKW